jgi:uncharacterized membrane protein
MSPIKPTFKTEVLPLAIIIAMAAASWYLYQLFPEQVPMHWNFAGEVDSYGSRAVGAFLMPAMAAVIYLVMLGLPFLDPRKARYAQFARTYHIFKALLVAFFALLYALISASSLGYPVNIGIVMPIAIGLLFIVMGNYMSKIKPNWFMGIRTPWTLSSESVWNKTHRAGGKIFIGGGLLFILEPFLPRTYQAPVFIFVIALLLVGTLGYSYVAYRSEKK